MWIPNNASHIRETGTTNLSSNISVRRFKPMTSEEIASILASVNDTPENSDIEVGNVGTLELSSHPVRNLTSQVSDNARSILSQLH